jgi:hypothetical protein
LYSTIPKERSASGTGRYDTASITGRETLISSVMGDAADDTQFS